MSTRAGSTGSATPLYRRTADLLRDRFAALPPGGQLPGEPALVEQLGVSRVTLRKAIELLVQEGLVVRRHGVGTFMAPARLAEPLIGLHSTRDLVAAHTEPYEVEIDQREVVQASPEELRRLRLDEGQRVLRYRRRDLVGGEPVSVAQIAVLARYAPQLDLPSLQGFSTYHLFETRCGLHPTRAEQTVRADAADAQLAGGLEVPRGRPVLVIDRVTFDADDTPIEWGTMSYRHDRVELSVELVRQLQSQRESARKLSTRYSRPKPLDGTED